MEGVSYVFDNNVIMGKKHEDIQELFVCRCHDIHHQFVISTVDFDKHPEVYLSVFLYRHGFFKRLMNGLRYILGHRSALGYFDEVILRPEDAPRLRKVVDMLEEVRRREEAV